MSVDEAFAAAVAVHQAGDVVRAEQLYRELLAQSPGHAPTLCNLGVLLVRDGKVDEAKQFYNLALAVSPDHPDAHFNLGNLYRRTNQLREAAAHFTACLNGNPNHASAAFNLGLVIVAAGDIAQAVELFRTAVRLEPQNADAHGRLGDVLVRTGELPEGVAAFRKSVQLKPNDHRWHYNLALALANSGDTSGASEHIQKALKLKPDYAEAHNALGLNLETLGRKDDALFHYQESVRLKPDLADGWSNLGTNLTEQGRADEAIDCLRESLVHRPFAPPIHSNLCLMLNYSSNVKPEEVLAEHRTWAVRLAGPTRDRPPVPQPHDPDRRLKIGYLSADFRNHTVSGFIETLLTEHDRTKFEVYAYASVIRQDETTAKLAKLADHVRFVGSRIDELVAEDIKAEGIDVLIDLGGHTAGNRLGIMAQRPAPLQATLFGYPNTTGIPAIDFRITDPVSDPPGTTEHLYVEGLLRLPETAWVYRPPVDAPPVTALPAATSKKFTFGCLNNPAKISDACFATWAKLIQSAPGSRLVLLAGQSQAGSKRLLDRFMKAGILRDRIELVMRLPKKDYFEAFQLFDISLDPFPYNGGVTTVDSLWMGVPVLGIAGSSYVSRQGAMVMHSVGLPEFVAESSDDLIRRAKAWMTRRSELAEIRAGLRERVQTSPIADGRGYVRNLETTLRRAWWDVLPV